MSEPSRDALAAAERLTRSLALFPSGSEEHIARRLDEIFAEVRDQARREERERIADFCDSHPTLEAGFVADKIRGVGDGP